MLPHYLAAPTLVTIGGVPHLADRLRLGDFALLLQAACDSVGRDIDDEPAPKFSDPDIEAWFDGEGLPLIFWCSLRRRWPDLGIDDAYDLAARLEEAERTILRWAAYRFGKRKSEGSGEGVDLALQKWGQVLRRFADEGNGLPPQVAEYTLDQADLLLAGEDPEARQEAAEESKALAEWKVAYDAANAERAAAGAAPAEVTLESLGYAVLPGQETPEETKADGDQHEEQSEDRGTKPKPRRPRRTRKAE